MKSTFILIIFDKASDTELARMGPRLQKVHPRLAVSGIVITNRFSIAQAITSTG